MVLSTPTKEQKREIDKIKKALDRNKDGAVSNTISNYVAILTSDPILFGAIRLNELSSRIHIVSLSTVSMSYQIHEPDL